MKDLKYLLMALANQPHRKYDDKTEQWESDTDFLNRLLDWLYRYDFENQAPFLLKEFETVCEACHIKIHGGGVA